MVSFRRAKTTTRLLPIEKRPFKRPGTTLGSEPASLTIASSSENGNNGPTGSSAADVVSAPTKPEQLSSLPPEVMHKILDDVFIMSRHPHDHRVCYSQTYLMIVFGGGLQDCEREAQRELFGLLLVSRAWYHLAIEHLYEFPVLCTAKQFHAMLDCVRNRPRLAQCVKTVRLYRYNGQWDNSQSLILKERLRRFLRKKNITELSALIALCPLAKMVVMTNNILETILLKSQYPPALTLAYTGPAVHSRGMDFPHPFDSIDDILPAERTFPALKSLSGTLILRPCDLSSSERLGSLYLTMCSGPGIRIPPSSALPELHTVGLYFSVNRCFANEDLISHANGLRELHLIGPWEHRALLALPLARFTSLRVLAFGFSLFWEHMLDGPILPDGPLPPTLSWLICMIWSRSESQRQQDLIAMHLNTSPMYESGLKGIHAVASMDCPRGKELAAFCESRGVRLTTDNLVPEERNLEQNTKEVEVLHDVFTSAALVSTYMNSTSSLDAAKRPWREVLNT